MTNEEIQKMSEVLVNTAAETYGFSPAEITAMIMRINAEAIIPTVGNQKHSLARLAQIVRYGVDERGAELFIAAYQVIIGAGTAIEMDRGFEKQLATMEDELVEWGKAVKAGKKYVPKDLKIDA